MNLNLGDTQLIIAECKKYDLLRNQVAYVLATAYHETAFKMKPIKEMGGEAYLKAKKYYPWYGRGYVQLTWEENYKKYGISKADDALKPDVAAYVLVHGMKNGMFAADKVGPHSLGRYITLQKSDFVNARRIVNGTDKAAQIAEYAKQYDKDLKAIGYGEQASLATGEGSVSQPEGDPVSGAVKLLEIIYNLIKTFLGK